MPLQVCRYQAQANRSSHDVFRSKLLLRERQRTWHTARNQGEGVTRPAMVTSRATTSAIRTNEEETMMSTSTWFESSFNSDLTPRISHFMLYFIPALNSLRLYVNMESVK